ncbi:MAG: alkaline phosphatase [Gemmatimonadales bacterium]|nr:alkaline phosphatase [Gemmatimonadales bacterium]
MTATGTKRLASALAAALLSLGVLSADAQRTPRRLVLFIGDGVGVAHWTAALVSADSLAIRRFPVAGLVDTRSSNSPITDSGAGATAYAAGVRTFNLAIGVGPDSLPVRTLLEEARDRGRATGLVATSSLTHATPASFAAHVPNRANQFEIARQMTEARVDVLLGGGRRWFSPTVRPDSADLLARLGQTHTMVTDRAGLAAVDPRTTRRLVGLFADDQMPAAATRTPTLPEMTRTALDLLARDPDGFFLMVEGSQPDWRAHENQPLALVAAEMLDFDRAIGEALAFQARHPETLIVVVADHETGGLAVELGRHPDSAASVIRPVARYTTTGHTAAMIPLFARGPGAERFGGLQPNWRIGQLLLDQVRR